jgi:hypothetical protein
MPFGSWPILVIQGSWSKITTREEKVANSKVLFNQWKNEQPSRD